MIYIEVTGLSVSC